MVVSTGFDLSALQRDYGDIDGEADSCRSTVALFDFSFMHRVRIAGSASLAVLQHLTPRSLHQLPVGRIAYALRVNAHGHATVDLTIWRIDETVFDLYSGRPDEVAAAQSIAASLDATVSDLTSMTSIYAVQGPACLRALADLGAPTDLRRLPYFAHAAIELAGVACRVGRLGYTGERGFEVIAPREHADRLWTQLSQVARPAGFAAADLLRIEAGFILFANELHYRVTPAALGLQPFAPAAPQGEDDVQLVCFQAKSAARPILFSPSKTDTYPPPPGTIVITSACQSARAGGVLGLGYSHRDTTALIDRSGRFQSIRRVALPFFDHAKRRPRGPWRDDLWPAETH